MLPRASDLVPLGLALSMLGAACGGGAPGGASARDGGLDGGSPFADAHASPDAGADAAVGDDAGGEDAAAPQPDAMCGPLTLALGGDVLEHSPLSSTDVAAFVAGTAPFTCSFLTGPGTGTRPTGAALDGCALSGGAGAGQAPGAYGFFVVVRDACGQTVEVPVAVQNAVCEDLATLTPAAWPPRVPAAPTDGYAWGLDLVIDLVSTGAGSCTYCFDLRLITRAPAQVSQNLDCDLTGTLCSDCDDCASPVTSCSGKITMSRQVTVKPHEPLRPGGAPAWLTVEIGMEWSGDSADPCGGKRWTCHVESFER